MIPKIIHYCWLSDDPIPLELQNYMNSWRKKLVGYEFILWNFNRFNIDSSVWVKQAFNAGKYAFAADFIRLYAVFNHGGIYLDMDVEVIKPFDKLLDSTIMMAYSTDKKTAIEAACFGAERGNFYIKNCLDYYENRTFIKGDGLYDDITLPIIMKKIFDESAFCQKISLYLQDYFTARGSYSGSVKITENTYCVHHAVGSWLEESEFKFKKFRKKSIKKLGRKIGSVLALFYFLFICIKNGDMKIFKFKIKGIILAWLKKRIVIEG
jgi:mannosyltransferase OCH1-like enzyme